MKQVWISMINTDMNTNDIRLGKETDNGSLLRVNGVNVVENPDVYFTVLHRQSITSPITHRESGLLQINIWQLVNPLFFHSIKLLERACQWIPKLLKDLRNFFFKRTHQKPSNVTINKKSLAPHSSAFSTQIHLMNMTEQVPSSM